MAAVLAATPGSTAEVQACFSPPVAGGCDPLAAVLDAIGHAHKMIRIQMYSLTLQEVVRALVKAKRRGIDVRVIVDRSQLKEDRSDSFRIASLAASGIPILVDSVAGLMHNKVMVIDGQMVLTGSFNYTWSAERWNAENLLVISDPVLAEEYLRNWEQRAEHSRPLVTAAGAAQTGVNPPASPVVGNRRSMIYEWPGCPYYDKIASRNRISFPSAEAAEAAGYHAAKNCP